MSQRRGPHGYRGSLAADRHDRPVPGHTRARTLPRPPKARTDDAIGRDLAAFVTWSTTNAAVWAALIPSPDPRGRLSASRFRRALAWFSRRRPRGLVAASIQYGRLYARMLQGYAGSCESGLPGLWRTDLLRAASRPYGGGANDAHVAAMARATAT